MAGDSQMHPNVVQALGRWASADVANNRGGKITNAGAGLYDLTLEGSGLGANECAVFITPEATALRASVTHTSATVKRITLQDSANVATNGNFQFTVLQFAGT